MRYFIVTLIALGLTSTLAMAATDQLAATKHNFTDPTSPYNALLGAGNTICQPCHTPHHAVTDNNISTRLWNHQLSGATYTLYDGSTAAFTSNIDGSQGMDRVSRLCLGCHDGTVALDSFGMGPDGSAAGHVGTTPFAINNVNNLGTNFTDDHPVGIEARVADLNGAPVSPYLKTPKPVFVNGVDATGGVKSVGMPVYNGTGSTLGLVPIAGGTGYYVGCRTCHNPHGSGTSNLTPYAHLLNCDPANLCNSCHAK